MRRMLGRLMLVALAPALLLSVAPQAADAAPVTIFDYANNNQQGPITEGVGAVCGWTVNQIQLSVSATWTRSTISHVEVSLRNNTTQGIWTYGGTGFQWRTGSANYGNIFGPGGARNLYGGQSGSRSLPGPIAGPYLVVYVNVGAGGGDCGSIAFRVTVR